MQKNKELLLTIGGNIRKYREHIKLTPLEVANILKISHSTVCAIERGERVGKNWVNYVYFLHRKGVDLDKIFSTKKQN